MQRGTLSRVGWCLLALAGCSSDRALPWSGFIDAPTAVVASQVAGPVVTLAVREGELVRRGQVLAQLDARTRAAAVEQAEANVSLAVESLAQARQNLRATLPSIQSAGADIQRVEATLDEAELNYERIRKLVAGNATPSQELDTARSRLRQARAQLQALVAGKASARGRVGAALAGVESARAAVEVSQAALHVAQVELAQATLLAPFDGRVVNHDLHEGEWAAAGTPVMTLEEAGRCWVRLDIEETRLGAARLGAPATITVLALRGQTFSGHVIEVGAQGEFAVNRDVKRGRPDLRTFRVRVGLDVADPALRPGMTAQVLLEAAADAGTGPDGGAPR